MSKPAVAVVGASPKAQRFSNKAVRLLKMHDYQVLPVHPVIKEIESLPVFKTLDEIEQKVHTVTIYVSADKSEKMKDEIQRLNPERVIFNPGTESSQLKKELKEEGIICIEACTLVMLECGEF